MFELLLNPKKAERKPWELLFVGLFYGIVSLLLVEWVFAGDVVLSKYSGIFLVTFTVMFSIPFVYYTIRFEENKISFKQGTIALLKEHSKALSAFLWLFLGFVIAFALGYLLFASPNSFKAQIETYCLINRPLNLQECVAQHSNGGDSLAPTAFVTNPQKRLLIIFTNNIYVLIFTLIFSLIFGAGVIFILSWNASVIAAAIGIYTNQHISLLPLGLLRYLLHGIPEIASYFIVALSGGLISISTIKHEIGTERFWEVLQDSLNLIILSIVVLFLAALLEVYITPVIF